MPNNSPVANAVQSSTEEHLQVLISADFTDADTTDSHTFSVDTTGTLGAVTNNNDGTFSYDPAAAFEHLAVGETATDTFTYTVDDGNGGAATETVTVTITGTNDAPVASAVSAAATENGSAVTITADFSDPDTSDSHTFSVDTTGTLGAVTNNNDGTFSYDPVAAFEHLAVGETATDTFTYTVDDGHGGTATETVTVTITGTNDAPVANAVSAAATENGSAVTISADFSDPDSSDSHTFLVDTTGTLGAVTNHNDGTFSYDPAAAFEHLAVGETATDTFTYTVDDGNGGAATETVTVTITGTNDAPVASAVSAAATENGNAVTITADFSDPDTSDSHTFSVDTTGTLGTVTNNNDGTFSYDPAAAFEHLAVGETATDSFTYTVDDGHGGTATETVTVTITGTNDAPVANAVSAAATENGSAVTISADFSDPDTSDSHTFLVDTTGKLGAVTNNNDGTFSYDPAAAFEHLAVGETATDSFTYTVEDGHGGTATETVTVTITGTNDAPVANAVSAAATENGSAVTISADFSDPDSSDSHTFLVDTTGTLGAVTNNNDGTFSYDPAAAFEHLAVGETATDSFTYTVEDGHGGTATETVTVTITGTNDAPVANAVSAAATENGSVVVITADFSDADTTDSHTFSVDTTGTLGAVTNNTDGTFSYDPVAAFEHLAVGETATDSFTYTVDDGHGGTATETVTVTITGTNDAPVANAVSAAATENSSAVTISADFSDPDTSDSHTFSVNTTGTLGSVTNNNDGTFSYDPAAAFEHLAVGETATDTFTYTVDDGHGGTATETVTVTITGTNDAPVASAVSAAATENGSAVTITADFSDPDTSDSHTFSVDTTGTLGAVTNNNDGTFSYDPAAVFEHLAVGETATDSFTYTVDDGNGGTATETVTVTITGTNDAPVADLIPVTLDEEMLSVVFAPQFSDRDLSDTHTISFDFSGSAPGTAGAVTDNGDGTYTYTVQGDYQHLGLGETSEETRFTYTVTDPSGASSTNTVVVTIQGRNDAPVAAALTASANEDGPAILLTATYSDLDVNDSHTVSVDTTGTLGTVTNHNDGTFSYDPAAAFEYLAAGETATDTFTYTVDDGNGGTATETVTVTIAGSNDGPVANAVVATATENGSAVSIAADFIDPDTTDSHTFTVDTTGTLGSVIDNGDGTFSYDPSTASFDYLAAGETATDTFAFTVTDASGASSTNTVSVTVTGENDAPVAAAVSGATDEDTLIVVSADFSDVDLTDSHIFSVDITGTLGAVINNGDGTFGYDPRGAFDHLVEGETATDTFSYTVDDGNGGTATETVTVTITGRNDVPVASPVDVSVSEDLSSVTFAPDFLDPDLPDSHTVTFDTGGATATATLSLITDNGDGTYDYAVQGSYGHLAAGETATESFTYTVTDSAGTSSTSSVTVTILGENDAPIALPVTASSDEDTAIIVSADFADEDLSDSHTFSVDTTGTIGAVVSNGDGTFSYDPSGVFDHLAEGEIATDTFTYTVDDGNGGTATETVTVTLTGINDAPIVSPLAASITEDGPSVTVAARFTDPDSDGPFLISIDTTGTIGLVTDNGDGTFSYSPNRKFEHLTAGQSVQDTFTYTVTDNHGASTTRTVTITVEGQVEPSFLWATDGEGGDRFSATAINDLGAVLVGAPADHSDGFTDSGSAYLFLPTLSGGRYSSIKLTASDATHWDGFGTSVALNDAGVAVVGGGSRLKAVYVFQSDGSGGYTETKLVSSDLAGGGTFGESVSINASGVIAVGASTGTGTEASTGSAYVYVPDGAGGYTETLLFASDGSPGDGFGKSVKVHDNGVVVVGALNGDGVEENTGAVYVYTPDGGGGYTEAKLTASEGNTSDFFGFSSDVNASGVVVVGAYGDDDFGAPNSGSAYVFTPDGAGGYTEVKLTALDRFDWDHFGYDVAINDSGAIVVGAYGNDDAGSASGAAYVYVPDGSGGYTTYKLTAPIKMRAGDLFGYSVDINEDGVVSVGAQKGDGRLTDSGVVYTFVPNADGDYFGYDEVKYTGVPADGSGANPGHDVVPLPGVLFATGGVAADQFHETAINDLGMVLVGAPGDHTGSLTNNGSVYLFRPNAAGSLHSPLQLTASDAANHDAFGNAIDLNNTGVAVVGGGGGLAAVYVFRPDGKGGYFETKLVSSDLAGAGRFGESVSINFDGVIAVGAPAGTGLEASTGSVYIYTPDGYGGFTETLLYASDGLLGDGFGSSVTIHDNGVVVVGATSGEGAEENTGAVYVYTPDGGGGYTEAKLTASEGNTSDFFGFSSDMNASGVVVVGAYGDDDFGAPNSGSAYVFTPDGAGGYTEVKLTALDRFDWDHFGYDVAINDSGAIVVGAYGNDDTGSASGAAYVYVPDGSGGYTSYKLTAPLRARVDNQFGRSVDINEDGVVMVGALNGDANVSDTGLVYTFVPNADGDYVGYDGIVFNGVPADGSGANPGHDVVPLPGVLFATGGVAADQFHETAINDLGMVLVGAPGDHTGSLTNNGSVYLFRPNAAGSLHSPLQLTASDAANHDAFGNAVDLNNTGVAVVGGGGGLAAVYVFRPDGKGGYFETKLVSSDLAGAGRFGESVSINFDGVIAVGAPAGTGVEASTGSVYIYTPDGYGGFTETLLYASDGLLGDGFGSSVTIHDNGVVVVGATSGEGAEENTGAVYVYTPDGGGGYTEAKLTASEGNTSDFFGFSSDMNASGVVVVGAYGDDDFGAPNSGSAYVFTPDGAGGYTEVKLTALDRFDWDHFGYDVAINDSGVIVVGAYGNDDTGSASGAAYVYVPDGSGGYTSYKLTAPLRARVDNQFGRSVDINEDGVVMVGALNGDGTVSDSGLVYTFVPNADGDYVGYDGIVFNGVPADGSGTNPDNDVVPVPSVFLASDGLAADQFHETAVNDLGMVLVGAPGDHTGSLTNNGSVYLYRPNAAGTAYTSVQLTASDAASHDGFGNAVALNNSGVAVVAGGGRLGAVYVFRPDGKGGMFEAKLVSSDLAGGGNFGGSISVNSNGVIAVGASTGNGLDIRTGSAYIYEPDGYGGYTETVLFAADGLPNDGFGSSVTVHDSGVVLVGASNGEGAEADTGAVYVYTPDGAGGYTEAKLIASEGNSFDLFGHSVDVNASGVIVVGAYGDDDFGAPNSGSAYVFTPDGVGGYTEVKLTALDRFDWDMFGHDVAINDSGVIVVGAHGNDDQGSASGAAYVYVPDGLGGYTVYKLTAPLRPGIDNQFGHSVDINDDGVVTVGALNGTGRQADTGMVYSFVPNADGDYVGFDGIVYNGVPADGSGTNPDHDVVPVPTWFKASDGETSDLFHETAVNDLGMVLIGAPGDHTDGLTNNGSVYLYRPNAAGTAYSSIQLTASDAAHHDGFGNAVALNNSGVAVVAGGGRLGAVYVFRPDGKGGMFEAKLVSSDLAGGGNFGVSVSVNSAGVIVAGASTGTGLEASTGSVYVYAPDGYGGYKETVLFASDGLPGDGFGNSVTVHDNSVVVVGATNGDGAAVNTGAVYVYTPDGAGGYSEAKLTASEGNVSDFFGFTSDVNASGVVVVGAYGDDDNGNPNAGSAYIYTPDGAGGYTEVKLVSLDRDDWDMFGYDVAINDSGVVVVGAYGNDDNGSATGSAYVYEPDGSGGYTSHKLTAPLWARIGDSFGHSVDINNDGVVTIGALNGDGRKTDSGSVFSYVPNENGDYVSYGGIVYSGTVSAGLNIVGSDAGNTLTGGASDDVLTGGLGNDTFVFAGPAFGHDTITDFAAGAATDDSVQLDASVFTDFADVLAAATEVGGNTVVTVGANASIELEGVSIASLHQDDFSFV